MVGVSLKVTENKGIFYCDGSKFKSYLKIIFFTAVRARLKVTKNKCISYRDKFSRK